jgi:hypothetical protein
MSSDIASNFAKSLEILKWKPFARFNTGTLLGLFEPVDGGNMFL